MFTEIGDPVHVETFFSGRKIIPRWFLWNGKKINIEQVTQSWEEKRCGKKTYHFAVYDGNSIFNIIFDPAGLIWTLAGVSDGL